MDVNKWFFSLPPERQAVLRDDKWMLANAAAQAATEAEREACAHTCDEGLHQVRENGWIDAANERARCAAAIRARSNA